jgi:hypothetical protein
MPRCPEEFGKQMTVCTDSINKGNMAMNDNFKDFKSGFAQGARETPRGFFAPIIAFFRWMDRVTDEVMKDAEYRKPAASARPEHESPSLPDEAPDGYQMASQAIARAQLVLEDARRTAFDILEAQDPELAALAIEVLGRRDEAIRWVLDEPLEVFRGRTAWEVASQGRAEAMIAYLDSISSGFVG